MSKRVKAVLLPSAAVMIYLIAAVICGIMARHAGIGLPRTILGEILAVLILQLAVLALALWYSVRKTLYSYTNIGLLGGILFSVVLLLWIGVYFFTSMRTGVLTAAGVFDALVGFPRRFSFGAVFVIFVLCFLLGISNIALIRHEGFRPTNALSAVVAGLYIGGTILIYVISDLLREHVFIPRGIAADPLILMLNTVITLFLLLLLCYFECILAGSAVFGWIAARTKPSYDKDFIIILGCSIDKRGGLLPLLKGRVNRAVRFAWEQEIATGKPMRYIPSGGKGPNEIMSEGSAMEFYLLTHGTEEDEVFPEKESRNTYENMCCSKKIIDDLMPGAKVAFATTNYHILRSGILARRAGLDAEGIAGDTVWYFWPNGFVREFFGILALNKRAHVRFAVFAALLCGLIGWIGYSGGFI